MNGSLSEILEYRTNLYQKAQELDAFKSSVL